MAKDYIPQNDREFSHWLENFIRVATPLKEELGISDAELAELSSFSDSFAARTLSVEKKRTEYKEELFLKDKTRDSGEPPVRQLVQRIQFGGIIDDPMRILLGISIPHKPPKFSHPAAPERLMAEVIAGGRIKLKWESGGNTRGVHYMIEVRHGDTGEYTLLTVTTRRSYIYPEPNIGKTLYYHVKAGRRNEVSAPSNTAVVGLY